jgi:quercetin dioxygenase-like cupin family protein
MTDTSNDMKIPNDDPQRSLTVADAETLPHIAVVGDTYTILVHGKQTAGRYCLIDMHIPKGGGPPLHRHNFEENFTVLHGEILVMFRDTTQIVRAGERMNIPANAPHHFTNTKDEPARLYCTCSPAGQEEFLIEIGVPVPTRTAAPPELSAAEKKALMEKTMKLAPRYATELLV